MVVDLSFANEIAVNAALVTWESSSTCPYRGPAANLAFGGYNAGEHKML